MGMFWVIRVIQIFFCIGCVTALFQFAFYPCVHRVRPSLSRVPCIQSATWGALTASDGVALVLATGLVVWYYVARHSGYAWVLQDCMALAMCAMFLKTVRVPNLRVAAVLLSVFFCYDIFMVFITPLLFHNRSVMVEVAKAGGAGAGRAELADDGRTCQHLPGERMPVLFMLPRMDYGGGYSMLGLGDVVMPGLLVCFALRYDCATRGPRFLWGTPGGKTTSGACAGPSYFILVSLGYGVGLLLALLANLFGVTFNNVHGQPALLYLVPCTLGVVAAAAWVRGDLADMWEAEGLLDTADEVSRVNGDPDRSSAADDGDLGASQTRRVGSANGEGSPGSRNTASSSAVRSREPHSSALSTQGLPLLDP
mmetsp:Transcript_28884/g.77713  ORF Transcript_28884/g.77713 Transcript_28884/m.77713 type:complete len:367 (+) Transcript_28884:50-1150(+)